MTTRSRIRYGLVAGLLIVGWIAASRLVVIPLIEAAYHGEGIGLLESLITGQETTPLGAYVDDWLWLSHRVTAVLGILALVGYLGLRVWGGTRTEDPPAEQEQRLLGPPELLLLAIWTGLVAGLAEGLYLTTKAFWLREPVPGLFRATQDALWMTPMVSLGVFLALGLIVLGAYRIRGDDPAVGTAAGLLAAPAALAVIMAPEWLDLWAAGLLALGIGVQTRRLIAPRPARFRRYVRRSTPWMAAAVLLFTVAVPVAEEWRERAMLADLGEPAEGAPNVLLIVLDTERASSLSLHGHERPTSPELEELARRGVVFDLAVSTSPFTLTSHATLFTGRWAHRLGVDWDTPLDRYTPTLAERMSEAGYVTGAFVANTLFCNDLFRLDRGFSRYEDSPVTAGQAILVNRLTRGGVRWLRRRAGNHQVLGRKTAEDVRLDFLDWLGGTPDRPFFAFLNFFDAHDPYLPPEPWNTRFTRPDDRYWLTEGKQQSASHYTREELSQLEASYDNGIAYLDHQLGLLFDELDRRGVLENTLVIVTSDHGEQFGEHGLIEHRNSLYMPLLHVPLVVLPPGGLGDRGGLRVSAPVSTRDLGATVLDVADVRDGASFPGASLRGYWSGGEVPPDTVLSEWGRGRSVVAGRLHLITTGADSVALYDLGADPGELVDLSSDPRYRPDLMALVRHLDASGLALAEPLAPQLTSDGPRDTGADRAGPTPDR